MAVGLEDVTTLQQLADLLPVFLPQSN